MAYKAMRVVNTFIKLSLEDKKPLTQLAILKMLYFAHAASLVLGNKRLIEESFEAWQFGPVIPEVYKFTKRYLNNPIEKPIGDFKEVTDAKDRNYIKGTYKVFKDYEVFQLVERTHKIGGAWHKARFDGTGMFNKIEDKDIQNEFKDTIRYKTNT